MRPQYFITTHDLLLLDIAKIMYVPTVNQVAVYFSHVSIPQTTVFSVSLQLDPETNAVLVFKLYEGLDVQVDERLKNKIKTQLTGILAPYLHSFTAKGGLFNNGRHS